MKKVCMKYLTSTSKCKTIYLMYNYKKLVQYVVMSNRNYTIYWIVKSGFGTSFAIIIVMKTTCIHIVFWGVKAGQRNSTKKYI